MYTIKRLALVGVALTGLLASCSAHEIRDTYHDVSGHPAQRLELNTATKEQLAKLPGLTDDDADRIIANRPYQDKRGLVRKSILSRSKYDKIEDHVYIYDGRKG